MKIPKIEVDETYDATILRSKLPGKRDIEVLTSYAPPRDEYVSTVHVTAPELGVGDTVIKEYNFAAEGTEGLWAVHSYAVGVVLSAAVLTGTITL
jgi:hypothetical protein